MTSDNWNWKNKDGSKSGLLYESGNWGDVLKLLWLIETLRWKGETNARVSYFDPFAGDVSYPLGRRTRFRLDCCRLDRLDPVARDFIDRGRWPSAASAALAMLGSVEVWDAEPGRRANWLGQPGAAVLDGDDGFVLLRERQPDEGVWMVDPYDLLADWRDALPGIVDKARTATVLVYLYNRSGKNEQQFRNYRAFRNALDDARGELPKRIGRVAADAFLPQCHHEMIFLPSEVDCRSGGVEQVMERLAAHAETVNLGVWRSGICDS
ncbi:MAG: hypothetical protein LUE17_11785 [Planctomycetaceae bacterium]|nr:hypothetical protein [Planctomycetaceae bacterium]